MEVDKVSVSGTDSFTLPLAAIFCIAIAAYVALIVVGLSVRQCLLKKGVCCGQCPDIPCCNCAELGLHCAQACCNCGPLPSCASLMDTYCPTDQECECLDVGSCSSCQECPSPICCENSHCGDACGPSLCGDSQLCECQSCLCTCAPPECSTINCLCCEITIKGRGTQGDQNEDPSSP
ncbi:hypothetical protein Pcinc_041252 [Petrolisthes cinctipes]|uniref:Uncharacterized protein n=1 Tax=Petrolisthes cinctipes TaxID=88211 RepID=A0AAE1EH47_PETCI|nr:hypothetical protein Pcinc_041252 [Petrolisthes cinctipes]